MLKRKVNNRLASDLFDRVGVLEDKIELLSEVERNSTRGLRLKQELERVCTNYYDTIGKLDTSDVAIALRSEDVV